EAQFNISQMYAQGQGVQRNDHQAAYWLRLAAENGLSSAQNNLGVRYSFGRGVPQDYVLAHMWFNLAAAQGYVAAHGNRDRLAAMMAPAQIAEAQRLAREWKPKSNQNMELKPEAHAICHVSENQREAGCCVNDDLACASPGTGLCWEKGHNPWLDEPASAVECSGE